MKTILFQAADFDYEEGYYLEIYEENGKYYSHETGHWLMSGDFDNTSEITHDEALEIMLENKDIEDTDYLDYWWYVLDEMEGQSDWRR